MVVSGLRACDNCRYFLREDQTTGLCHKYEGRNMRCKCNDYCNEFEACIKDDSEPT